MADKLETFIEGHLEEFDTVELPGDLWAKIDIGIEAGPLKVVKSKLLAKFIYFGLSSIILVTTVIYFASRKSGTSLSVNEKTEGSVTKDAIWSVSKEENLNQPEVISQNTISGIVIEKQKNANSDLNNNINTTYVDQDTAFVYSKDSVYSTREVQKTGIKGPCKITLQSKTTPVTQLRNDTSIFYHISFNGGPYSKQHALFWYTERETPKTYFIIEHFCWNKWVNRGKVTGKGRPGTGIYSGKEPGKYRYKFKIAAHSGENIMRVLQMNDSNSCIAVSKELKWLAVQTEKVDYTIKKRAKEISFNNATYYELYDSNNIIVKQGYGKTITYDELPKGVYRLNYDNFTTTIKLK